MRNPQIIAAFSVSLLLLAGAAAQAHAQDKRIAVLTPTIDEPDDSLAIAVGDALREEVRSVGGFVISEARISLEQLSIANDCEVNKSTCLRKIAKGLSVDGLVYTSISRKQGTSELVDVRYFDAADDSPTNTGKRATHVFVTATPSQREIDIAANGLVVEMFGTKPADEPALASEQAAFAPEAAAPSATAAGGEPAVVDAADYAEERKSSGMSVRRVAGYTLLGVAVVSVGLSALSFIQIDRAESDEAFHDYQVAVGKQEPMVTDVCDEANHGERHGLAEGDFASVRDRCSMGGTYEVLQYVFIGAAVVSGGASAYLLLSADDHDDARASAAGPRLSWRPVIGRRSAVIHASLTF